MLCIVMRKNTYTVAPTFDPRSGLGAVPFNEEVDYRGFKLTLTPAQFLSLASKRQGEGSKEGIIKEIQGGRPVGPPFLNVDWEAGKGAWIVTGHEGRNRSDALSEIYGKEVRMEVHVFPRGMRAGDITESMKRAPFIPEEVGL
jgi:hypothetical protein